MASFKSLNSWLEDLKKYGEEDIVVLVVGNKSDGVREVEESVARKWAEEEGLEYVETSALNGEGVDEVCSCSFRYVQVEFTSRIGVLNLRMFTDPILLMLLFYFLSFVTLRPLMFLQEKYIRYIKVN